jgi:hypothetical protein
MKKLALALVAASVLTACSFDRTLDALIPGSAYGVILADHPALTAQLLGQTPDLPWGDLDGGKPWAAAVLPGSPPVIFVALALADKPTAWADVEAWARSKTGLAAARSGTYAVLTSGQVQDSTRFDLSRVRHGDLISVYLNVKNLLAPSDSFSFLKTLGPAGSVIEQNLAGVHIGFGAKDGGVSVVATSDLRADAPARSALQGLGPQKSLAPWTGLFGSGDGIRLAGSFPPELVKAAGSWWKDPLWTARWNALAPLLGPGLTVAATPKADGTWSWSAAVEASDPQAVRQALKTLVAGGDLQKQFPAWSLDADTPLIYQDKPDVTGIRTQVTLGTETVQLAWGDDRVALAGGAGAAETLVTWKRAAPAPVSWFGQVPSGSLLVGDWSFDGLGARSSLRLLADGNVELNVWTDAAGLKAWEARAPQVLQGWLGGGAGSKP